MFYVFVTVVLVAIETGGQENLKLLTKSCSTFLDNYEMYMDAVILHLSVPADIPFVSFKFIGEEHDTSIFGCEPNDIELYLKHGSPPVINPDCSKFPEGFYLSRSDIHKLKFRSDKVAQYINMTVPMPGPYYVAVFKPYINPKEQGITQEGLRRQCFTFVETYLYAENVSSVFLITEMQNYTVYSNASKIFKFFVPDNVDHVALTLNDIKATDVRILIQSDNVPTIDNNLVDFNVKSKLQRTFQFWSKENKWHYIKFLFPNKELNEVRFDLKFFSSALLNKSYSTNETNLYQDSVLKTHRSDLITSMVPYRQYDLVRDVSSESFLFSFDLKTEIDALTPLSINLTSNSFAVLKFAIQAASDIGGTLQIILAYKPRITMTESGMLREKEPESHVVVACLQNSVYELPTWPNKCVFNSHVVESPLILNKEKANATIYIPYPDLGSWFLSFKLFCGKCEPCNCTDKCEGFFKKCLSECELNCLNKTECNSCYDECRGAVIEMKDCAACDCDGPCQKTTQQQICNSSLVFDVSSYPCVSGKCAANGKCMLMISQGHVFSTCVCKNNYKGWDCSDDSNANSYAMIVLELVLLVLSNIMFLPSTYFAYKRKYYVEAVVYFSTCFFSTFYHACDAGENIISFCITKVGVLQFSDFFSALLSIWVTMIAMAYLPKFWPSICHMAGAILIAFGTTVKRQSLWVFVIPVIIALIIIAASWYTKFRATRRLFPSRKYLTRFLPVGLITVATGLVMYTFMQTQSNYKYLHSIWHILMAVAVIFLLPDERSFLPEPSLYSTTD